MGSRRKAFALASAVAFAGVPVVARADEPVVTVHEFDPNGAAASLPDRYVGVSYLDVGPIFSFVDSNAVEGTVPGRATAWNYGFGLEASLVHYRMQTTSLFGFSSLGYGAFVQTELQQAKYLRCDLGVQGNYGLAGLELGLGMRQGDGTFGTTASAHFGFFLSLGYFVLGYRASPALFSFPSNEPSFGFDTAVSLSLKLPIVVQGHDATNLAWEPGRR
jgi:hypothetical protein